MKSEIAHKNKTFKIKDAMKLLETLLNVFMDDWKKCVKHVGKLQEEDFCKSRIEDKTIKNIVMNLRNDSESSFREHELISKIIKISGY